MTDCEVEGGKMTAEEQAKELAKTLEDTKAVDVRVYDVRGTSGFTDYVDVVVHVFSAEARAYYALEKLWAVDAKG